MIDEMVLKKLELSCAKRENSPADIRIKLHKLGIDENSDEYIDQLKAKGYIDETRFAKSFVHDKLKFNKWGKIRLKHELHAREISEGTIDNALKTIDTDNYEATVYKELEKKASAINTTDKMKLQKRIMSFGHSRGYEYELIIYYLKDSSYM